MLEVKNDTDIENTTPTKSRKKRTNWYSEEKFSADVVQFKVNFSREYRQDAAIIDSLRSLTNAEIPVFVKELLLVGFLETLKCNNLTLEQLETLLQAKVTNLEAKKETKQPIFTFPPLQAYYMGKVNSEVVSPVSSVVQPVQTAQMVQAIPANSQSEPIQGNQVVETVSEQSVVVANNPFEAQSAPPLSGIKQDSNEPSFLSRLKQGSSPQQEPRNNQSTGPMLGGF